MARILIIYSNTGKLEEISRGLTEGIESLGHKVDILTTSDRDKPVSFHPYDAVLVGSPTRGIFRGKIAEDIPAFLKKCKRTMGQLVMAFVTPRFFATGKALIKLMNELEKHGCFVKDFKSLRNYQEAVDFGKKINDLI